jgi:hypothetical protein
VQIVRHDVNLAAEVLDKVRGRQLGRFPVGLKLGEVVVMDPDGVGSGTVVTITRLGSAAMGVSL